MAINSNAANAGSQSSSALNSVSVPEFGRTPKQLLEALKLADHSKQRQKPTPSSATQEGYATLSQTSPQSRQQHPPRTGQGTVLQSPFSQPAKISSSVRSDRGWKAQTEVGVRIDGLADGITTLDIYRHFKREGDISRIQVPGHRPAASSYVNFSPPPHRAFWAGEGPPIVLPRELRSLRTMVAYTITQPRTYQVASPTDPNVVYDETMTLPLQSIDFGFMRMMDQYSVMHSASAQRVTLNLRSKRLVFQFSLPANSLGEQVATEQGPNRIALYRFEIQIRDLIRIRHLRTTNDKRELLLTVKFPPEFYRRMHNVEATHDPDSNEWNSWYAWLRQTDITVAPQQLHRQIVTLCKTDALIDIGRWTTYRLHLSNGPAEQSRFDVFQRALEDHHVPFEKTEEIQCSSGSGKKAEMWEHIDLPEDTHNKPSLAWFNLDVIGLPFAVRYQLEVCLSRSVLNEHNITRAFLEQIMELGEQRATSLLESAALQHTVTGKAFDDPVATLALVPGKPAKKRSNGHLAYIRAAQITPTTIYYATPVLETSNRVIRDCYGYEDRFLRVRFSDEVGKIRAKERDTNEELFNRIRRAMSNGIRIGDRHYEFLAFGNSQLREHAAYFFASTGGLTASEIRRRMGDLSTIRTVAKWSARLGQSFSTTRSINSARVKVSTESDISRNGYNFSDGVGKMSQFLAYLISIEFGLRVVEGTCPSLFQFRMGGCKGVLVADPALVRTQAQAQEVVIRESQYKFPAAHQGLDVIRYSSFAASMLNRQIIIVLDTLGVPPETFLTKQQNELAELEQAMHDRDLALCLLRKRIDFNQMTLTVASLVLDGFMDSNEPFAISVLQLWRAWNIKYLKEKARITVDKGAFLLGCVDETGSLRGHYATDQGWRDAYGPDRSHWLPEIFVQVRDPPHTGPFKVRTGRCLLARNPSLHPGDVRVVKAVDVPSLRHLKDVVVMPQTGDRDVPNMCSGGDLDGDDYLVMWDEDLFPPDFEWNRKAMDFKPPKGTVLNREVVIDDAKEFFIQYIKNNRLEVIAVSHLAQADQSEEGVDDPKCIALAELHSCAVDYAKSGVPAKLDRTLIPRTWPHFMEKDGGKSYKSTGVLGRLYDQVQLVDFKPSFELEPDRRILQAYDWSSESMNVIMLAVREVKVEYDKSLRRIMAKHSIDTEFEVWSTFVLSHNRDKGDYKFHEEIGNLAESLKARYKDEIFDLAQGRSFQHTERWVAAMYKVTADEMAEAVAECKQTSIVGGYEIPIRSMTVTEMPLMSFPWIFYSELGKIATGADDNRRMKLHNDLIKPESTIDAARPAMIQNKVEGECVVQDLEGPGGKVIHAGEALKLFHDNSREASPASSGSAERTGARSLKPQDSNSRKYNDFAEGDCSERNGADERSDLPVTRRKALDAISAQKSQHPVSASRKHEPVPEDRTAHSDTPLDREGGPADETSVRSNTGKARNAAGESAPLLTNTDAGAESNAQDVGDQRRVDNSVQEPAAATHSALDRLRHMVDRGSRPTLVPRDTPT